MVYRTVRFRCEKCRRGFPSYDEAWDCELGHVTDDAIKGFKGDLDRILRGGEDDPAAAIRNLGKGPRQGEG